MKQLMVAVATFSAFALAACGGPAAGPTARSSSAPATSTPLGVATPVAGPTLAPPASTGVTDPAAVAAQLCAAASGADVSAAMHQAAGEEYAAGVPDPYGQCTWRVGGAPANNGDGQLVAAFLVQSVSFIKSTFPGGVDVNVDGHAGYWHPGEGLQSQWVDVGDGRLLVLSFDPVTDTTQTSAAVLARLFLSKI